VLISSESKRSPAAVQVEPAAIPPRARDQPDDRGLARREGERAPASSADRDRRVRTLDRCRPPLQIRDGVMAAGERHALPGEQPLDDRDRLFEPRDPRAGRVEADARLVVLLS